MISIREVPWADPRGEALRTAQRAELAIRYKTPDSEPGPAPTADDMAVFLVAFEGGAGGGAGGGVGGAGASRGDGSETAIGCGGLRPLGEACGELKRMYVVPASRGAGVSTAILHALEAAARERGWDRLLLETGERQPDAIRFYEREGYSRIPNFGHYVHSAESLCFEKRLDQPHPSPELGAERPYRAPPGITEDGR